MSDLLGLLIGDKNYVVHPEIAHEFERLRATVDALAKENKNILFVYDKRIEKLEDELNAEMTFLSDCDVIITTEQIDKAWKVATSEEPYADDCLAELHIVACYPCAGTGIHLYGSHADGWDKEQCQLCKSHGWVWKEKT